MTTPWYELPLRQWVNNKHRLWFKEIDWQRSKAYAAERTAWYGTEADNDTFDSVPEIQAYIDKLMASAWFRRRWPHTRFKVQVKDGRARYRTAAANRGQRWIKLPRWSRKRWLILHELAHICTPHETGGKHGRYWARTYLELVRHEMGEDAHKLLKLCFQRHKVKFNPRRKLTAQQHRYCEEAAFRRFHGE
jgi:putative metallohydrolase (TIGR04338 family)